VIASICRPKSGGGASSARCGIGKKRGGRRPGHRLFCSGLRERDNQQNQGLCLIQLAESATTSFGGGLLEQAQRQTTSRNGPSWRRPRQTPKVQLMISGRRPTRAAKSRRKQVTPAHR